MFVFVFLYKIFIKTVGCFYWKFSGVHMVVKECLFESLCMSLYDMETIVNRKGCKRDLDRLGISYHYAVKRLMGLPKFYSNHHACALLGKLTFANLMNWRTVKFFIGLCKSESPCLTRLRTYISRFSNLYAAVRSLMFEKYSIVDIFDNDIDAVHSRICFMQAREPSSSYGVPPPM